MLSWQVGAVKVTRVVEMELPVKAGADFFMPQATPQELRKTPWLYPNFVSEDEIMQMSATEKANFAQGQVRSNQHAQL